MMDLVQHYLYLLSNALLLPTLTAILALAAWTVVMLGGLLREWLARKAVRDALSEARTLVKSSTGTEVRAAVMQRLRACPAGLPSAFVRTLEPWSGDPQEAGKCLEDLESDTAARLTRLTWVTRIAPMLGLMGTLIPLGPALTGLAAGDVTTLSSNLVVAFTATVVGVLIGCSSYTLHAIRRTWYHRDLGDLEHIMARLNTCSPPP